MNRFGFGWNASAATRLAWVALYAILAVCGVLAVENMSVGGARSSATKPVASRTSVRAIILESTAPIREWKVRFTAETRDKISLLQPTRSDAHHWRGEIADGKVTGRELFIEALGAEEASNDARALKVTAELGTQSREKIIWSEGDAVVRIDLEEWSAHDQH